MAGNEAPPAAAPPPVRAMQLTFRDNNNNEVTFKLRPQTKFGRAFDAFAQKAERELNELRFLYEGQRLNADNCIEEIGMEDGDTVDVFMEQIGGAVDRMDVNKAVSCGRGD